MTVYGYARVSRKTQDINRQIRNIKSEYPDAIIVQEAYTGTKVEGREKFIKLLANVKSGDTIVFDSVSRMSRDAEDGTKLYFELYDKGINLVYLKEHYIDSQAYKEAIKSAIDIDIETGSSVTDNLVSDIFAAINRFMTAKIKEDIRNAFLQAEKEVKDLKQRTREGLVTAKLNGKRVGAQKGDIYHTHKGEETKSKIQKYSKDFDGTLNDVDVIKLIGVSHNTYYKYKKQIQYKNL